VGRADGIHWGTGEDENSGIWTILSPDSPTILNEPEARWHMATVAQRRPQALNVYRASPDQKPASSGWDAHAYSRSVFQSIDDLHDRTGYYPSDILLLNELNLDYERGDSKNDGGAYDTNPDNWPSLYRGISRFLQTLRVACQERATDRGFAPRWWYQGWAPGHGETNDDISALWVPSARLYDGIVLHAYTSADEIESRVRWYADHFPGQPLLIGEWNTINLDEPNSDRRFEEEIQIRIRLRQLCQEFPLLQACYFIYAWAEDRHHEHDIRGNDRRLSIWDGRIAIPEVPSITPPLPLPAEPPAEPAPTTPEVPPMAPIKPLGIDAASYQGYINWELVKAAGYAFGVTKFTEGLGYINPTADHNWRGMKDQGMKRFGYHWGKPMLGARQQADFFWAAVQDAGGWELGDVLVLDMEESTPIDEAIWSMQFFDSLDDRIPADSCMLYSGKWFLDQEQFADNVELRRYKFWDAAYQGTMPEPPAPFDRIDIWQFSDRGSVPGVDGNVDLDEFNGTYDELMSFGFPADTGGDPGSQEPPTTPDDTGIPPSSPGGPPDPPTMIVPSYRWDLLVRSLGYATGDLADRVEQARAAVAGDVPRVNNRMTRAQLADALNRLWANVDAEYKELGTIKDELLRLRRDAL
jgi:lysozyme